MKLKEVFLNVFGAFYIIIGLLAFYNSVVNTGLFSVFWLSYTVFFLIGCGILFRNSYLIGSQLNIAFIPYLSWSIDFYSNLLLQKNLWDITSYLFLTKSFLSQIISVQHLFIIPIALVALYFIKFKRKDFWILSMIQIIFFFVITRIFTDPSKNINCVFESCISVEINPVYYPLAWFITYVVMILAVNFFLTKIKILKMKH